MAYGTAPHRIAPGVWATQSGRRLTPAGSAYWEHHHQQGLVTADGHSTQRAKSIAFGKALDPTRPALPAPKPPKKPFGQPTITRGQWGGMTPKQKMAVETTVTLTPKERARLAKLRAQAMARPEPPPGYRYTSPPPVLPPVPKKINQAIGFRGASGIDTRMAAIAAAEAAFTKERSKFNTLVKIGGISPQKADEAARQNLAHPQKSRGFLGHTGLPAIAHGLEAGAHLGQAAIEAGGMKVGRALGVDQLTPWHPPEQRPLGPIPGGIAEPLARTGAVGKGLAKATSENLLFGPSLTALGTGGHPSLAGVGIDVAMLIPGLRPIRAARGALAGARAAKAAEGVERALTATERAQIPERVSNIENWTRLGTPKAQIKEGLKWYDNQAKNYPGGEEAFWRERVRHPTGQAPEAVAAAGGDVLYQPPHIPKVVYPEAKKLARAKAKLNPRKASASGVPSTPDIFHTTPEGDVFKIAGNVTKHDWVDRVLKVVKSPEERDALARWYEHYEPMFRNAFGKDADAIMRGFAVSQANASPSSGLTAVLKVMDILRRGGEVGPREISVVGQSIQAAVENKEIDKKIAAKLSDFVDSLAGKRTRTWMGDLPEAGSPAAVDVHAIRDRGFIDPKLKAKVEAKGFTAGKDFRLEGTGSATGPLYERISEWYHEIADHLNEIRFDGRADWTPAQAQALGWSTIQKAHGVVPEGFTEAFARNSRLINLEVTKGPGGLGADLTEAQARRVAKSMVSEARALAEDIPGLWVQDVQVGHGGWNQGTNPTIALKVIGSKEAVQDSLQHFAQAFDQEWVQATREVSGKGSKATLVISAPGFKDPRTAGRFFKALNKINPKLEGYMKYDHNGVPAIAIRTTSGTVSPKTIDAWLARHADAIAQAEKETGVNVDYTAKNIEMLTGGQHGAEAPLRTLPGAGGRRVGELDHPRSAGIRSKLELAIEHERAGRGVPVARGEHAERVGVVYQRNSPKELPRGATEFLSDGGTRMHFFEGTDISTMLHELFHVSIHDLRGAHLKTLADEFAGGKKVADWTESEHEAVASAFEHWLQTGETTNSKLKSSFQAVKEWMQQLMGRVKAEDFHLPADVEEAFNYMFREPIGTGPEKQVLTAVRRYGPGAYAAQEAERSVEMAKRSEQLAGAAEEAGGGAAGLQAKLGVLEGELPRGKFDWLTHLTKDDMDRLHDIVAASPKIQELEKVALSEGLKDMQAGLVPTPSQRRLVEKVFGPSKTRGAKQTALLHHMLIAVSEILNIPRSFMASMDVSGVFRQALVAFAMHPLMVSKEIPKMLKYLGSEEAFTRDMAAIERNPRAKLLMDEGGLELTELGNLQKREEAFSSNYAEKITSFGSIPGLKKLPKGTPGRYGPIRASGRAYTGLLNNVRVGLGENMLRTYERNGIEPSLEELKDIGRVANWATGRGHLGKHEDAKVLLNAIFFSPRLVKSRLDLFNPLFYTRLSPVAQREAIRGAMSLVAGGVGLLAVAKETGLADVNLDPTSSDFGKLKIGNTRVDVWGGHQAVAKTLAQMLYRRRTSTTTGESRHVNVLDPPLQFLKQKLSPPFSLAEAYREGKTPTGAEFNWPDAAKNMLIPLVGQDATREYFDRAHAGDEKAIALLKAAAVYGIGAVGFGTNTYPMDPVVRARGPVGGGASPNEEGVYVPPIEDVGASLGHGGGGEGVYTPTIEDVGTRLGH